MLYAQMIIENFDAHEAKSFVVEINQIQSTHAKIYIFLD